MDSPDLELVSHHLCPYVQRAIITLDEKGIGHRRRYIDLAAKPDWFLSISPFGKVPLLRVDHQHVLFESAVICEYLDEITPGWLLPTEPLSRARLRAWIEFGSAILNAIAGFYNAPDEESFEIRRRDLVSRFERLEGELSDGPWFAGEHFSLVDATYGPIFRYFDVFDEREDFARLGNLPRVMAWRAALAQRPSVRDAVTADYPARLRVFLAARGSHLAHRFEQGSLALQGCC